MASFRKKGSGWVAEASRAGVRRSRSFDTKAQAVAWAAKFEAELMAAKNGVVPDKTFADLLIRYANEVSPKKRGERWEQIRIAKLAKMPIGDVRLPDLRPADFSEWRDARLKEASLASVHREMALMSHACTIAAKEWQWLHSNPMMNVSRPKLPEHRDRRIEMWMNTSMPVMLRYWSGIMMLSGFLMKIRDYVDTSDDVFCFQLAVSFLRLSTRSSNCFFLFLGSKNMV